MNTLPPPWKAVKDPQSGREYYYNPVTKKTQWEKPKEEVPQAVPAAAEPAPLPETPQRQPVVAAQETDTKKQQKEANETKSEDQTEVAGPETGKSVVEAAREESAAAVTPQPKVQQALAASPAAVEPVSSSATAPSSVAGVAGGGFGASSMSMSRASVGSTASSVAEIQDEAIADLSRLLTRATKDHAALHEKLASMTKVLDRDLPKAKAEVDELQLEKQALTQALVEAEAKAEAARTALGSEQQKIGVLEEEVKQLSDEKTAMAKEIDNAQATIETLKSACTDAEKGKMAAEASLGAKAGELAEEYERTEKSLREALATAKDNHSNEIEAIKASLGAESAQASASHRAEVEELKIQIGEYETALKSAQNEKAVLQEDHQRRLNEMEAQCKTEVDNAKAGQAAEIAQQFTEKLNEKDIIISELKTEQEKQLTQYQESMAALQAEHESAMTALKSENDKISVEFLSQFIPRGPESPKEPAERYLSSLQQEGVSTKQELSKILSHEDLTARLDLPLLVKAELRDYFSQRNGKGQVVESSDSLLEEMQLLRSAIARLDRGASLPSSKGEEDAIKEGNASRGVSGSGVSKEIVEEEVVVLDETVVNESGNVDNGVGAVVDQKDQEEETSMDQARLDAESPEDGAGEYVEEQASSSPNSPLEGSTTAGPKGGNGKGNRKNKRR